MANGDLDGDLGTAGMTPEQRAALKAKLGQQTGELRSARINLADLASGTRQTSFDASNTPAKYLSPNGASPAAQSAGPVGRATQQIGGPAPTPAQANPQTEKPLNLAEAFSTGIGDGRSAIYAGVGANGEASFSSAPSTVNTVGANYSAPDVPQEQRMASLSQAWQMPANPAPAQQGSINLANAHTLGSPGASTPNQPMTAAPQQLNLADANTLRNQPPLAQDATLASMGSVRNMGDGIGAFSQAEPGDAALASGRFQKAIDLRNGYADQDRLRNAVAAQTRDSHFNVVHDSSRPLTRREIKFDQDRATTTQSLADAVTGSQAVIDNRRQGVAADQKLRQATRLEDLMSAATAPNAPPEALQALRRVQDPFGDIAKDRELKQAQIDQAKARTNQYQTTADKNSRTVKGLPATLQKMEDGDIEAIGSTKTMNDSLDKIHSQISDGSLQLGVVENATSSVMNALGKSDESSANHASFEATLEKLRNESLRLNKGTQTNDDAVRAWNELITNIKDPKIVQQRIKEIAGYNNAASGIKAATINNRRRNQGLDELNVDEVLAGTKQQPPQSQPQPRQQGAPEQQPAAQPQRPVYTISTDDQYARLPSGAQYIDPQGNHRSKP